MDNDAVAVARAFLNRAILPNAVIDVVIKRTIHARKLREYVIVTTGDTKGLVTTDNDHNVHREHVTLGQPSDGDMMEIQVLVQEYNKRKQSEFNKRAPVLQSLESQTWGEKTPYNQNPR